MAITNYSYSQIANGLSGYFNTTSDPLKKRFNNKAVLVLRITGTDATLKVNGGASQPYRVTVDNVASIPTISGGSITLFTGLADVIHEVTMIAESAYITDNNWLVTNESQILTVTGASPAITPIPLSFTTWSTFPGVSTVFTAPAPGGTITPVELSGDFGGQGLGGVTFRAQCDTLYVFTGSRSVKYSVDGGTIQSVTAPDTLDRPRAFVMATGLDGTTVHTYTVWDNVIINTAGKLQAVGGTLAGVPVTLSAPTGLRKKVYQYGDSITEATTPGQGTMDLFQVGLNLNLDVASYGVSGYTISQLTTLIPSTFTKSVVPDFALLTIGRNDVGTSAGTIQTLYTACINALLTAGCTKIICRGILPEGANVWPTENGAIQASVTSFSNPSIVFMNTSTWSGIATSDSVHPTAAGYVTLAGYETTAMGPLVTAYAVTGPTTGEVSQISSNFTLQASGTIPLTVFTPSDGGGGGTFVPATTTLPAGLGGSATFGYVPASTGAKTLSFTNSSGLLNPSNITYTATAVVAKIVITALMTKGGVPHSSYTPTITIYKLSDTTSPVSSDSMVAIGTSGIFKYNFTTFKYGTDYAFIITGDPTVSSGERLQYGTVRQENPDRPIGIVVTDAGNSVTAFKSDRTETTTNHWKDTLCMMMTGALAGQVQKVSGYNGTTKIITLSSAFTGTPGVGDTYQLISY